MATKYVRIIETRHVAVEADYGDTEQDLLERALDDSYPSKPVTETVREAVLIPDELEPRDPEPVEEG